jgi:hypothetical protein
MPQSQKGFLSVWQHLNFTGRTEPLRFATRKKPLGYLLIVELPQPVRHDMILLAYDSLTG